MQNKLTSAADSSCVSNRGLPLRLPSSLFSSDSSLDRFRLGDFPGFTESTRLATGMFLCVARWSESPFCVSAWWPYNETGPLKMS
jgi:hypothetical protein